MGIKFANGGYATLASSITSGDTSITLTTGQGARFPSLAGGDYFYATLIDTSNNLEIVKCTARSTDVLTVTRAQESTTARAYSAGDRIELRITAAGMTDDTAIIPAQSGNSGKYLTTNGSVTSWGTVDLTNLNASNLTSGTIPDARMPSGAVLQTVSAQFTAYRSVSVSTIDTFVDVSGWTLNITPYSTSSKILVLANSLISNERVWVRLMRDSTPIAYGDSYGGSRATAWNSAIAGTMQPMMWVDSPSTTSSITYKVQLTGEVKTFYVGAAWNSSVGPATTQYPSVGTTLIAMEIAP